MRLSADDVVVGDSAHFAHGGIEAAEAVAEADAYAAVVGVDGMAVALRRKIDGASAVLPARRTEGVAGIDIDCQAVVLEKGALSIFNTQRKCYYYFVW